jgi:hypothetical protein
MELEITLGLQRMLAEAAGATELPNVGHILAIWEAGYLDMFFQMRCAWHVAAVSERAAGTKLRRMLLDWQQALTGP